MTDPHWPPSPFDDAGQRKADDLVAAAAEQRPRLRPDIQTRPGTGPDSEHIATVDWRNIAPEDEEPTFAALTEFLTWAVPRWGFTADQFPYGCWWMHSDVLEEMTAWWTLWQAYIRNPYAHPADPIGFNERTNNLKTRLAAGYRGRCRKGHELIPHPDVATPAMPPLPASECSTRQGQQAPRPTT